MDNPLDNPPDCARFFLCSWFPTSWRRGSRWEDDLSPAETQEPLMGRRRLADGRGGLAEGSRDHAEGQTGPHRGKPRPSRGRRGLAEGSRGHPEGRRGLAEGSRGHPHGGEPEERREVLPPTALRSASRAPPRRRARLRLRAPRGAPAPYGVGRLARAGRGAGQTCRRTCAGRDAGSERLALLAVGVRRVPGAAAALATGPMWGYPGSDLPRALVRGGRDV